MAVRTHSTSGAVNITEKPASLLWDIMIVLNQLATLANELKADLNLITTKLDGDSGINDTDYSSLHTIAAADGDTLSLIVI